MNPDQMQQFQNMSPVLGAGLGIGILVVYVACYLFFAFCLAKIAEKLGQPFGKSFLMAIIPIVNLILIVQLAGKPMWWVILFLIPIVNVVMAVLAFMAIAEKRGKPSWYGILMIVPIVNIFILINLAFAK
ncbi:MAG: DUF5684 domain-containing protein [bacterium]